MDRHAGTVNEPRTETERLEAEMQAGHYTGTRHIQHVRGPVGDLKQTNGQKLFCPSGSAIINPKKTATKYCFIL